MYVYTWRTTILFYVYRMKTLPVLSFWRTENMDPLFESVTDVSTDIERNYFFFYVLLFTLEELFQGVVVVSLNPSTFDHAFAF